MLITISGDKPINPYKYTATVSFIPIPFIVIGMSNSIVRDILISDINIMFALEPNDKNII